MAEYTKPLPVITEEAKPYWEGCKKHLLLVQKCKDCGHYQFPFRTVCTNCFSFNVEAVKASGKGTVYSYSTIYRAPSKPFEADIPYTLAFVDLDEGPRMETNIIGCKPEEVKIGMKVEVAFEDVTSEVTIPKFKLVKK